MRDLSIGEAITLFAGLATEVHHHAHHALEKAAEVVEAEAKAEIGHYQGKAGPFAAWAELADSTKDDRVKKGYSENDPLLREGTLRDSIHHKVEMTGIAKGEAHIGSDNPIAVYQELGTAKIPPRSFLGGALVRKTAEVLKLCGHGTMRALHGQSMTAPVRLD